MHQRLWVDRCSMATCAIVTLCLSMSKETFLIHLTPHTHIHKHTHAPESWNLPSDHLCSTVNWSHVPGGFAGVVWFGPFIPYFSPYVMNLKLISGSANACMLVRLTFGRTPGLDPVERQLLTVAKLSGKRFDCEKKNQIVIYRIWNSCRPLTGVLQ